MKPTKILVVDDEAGIRDFISKTLRGSGLDMEILEADDGRAGLETAQGRSDLDFLIVDYNMPRMNGLEMIEKLLAIEAYANTPMMIYTTETNIELVAKARALSRRIKWVIKPLNPETFVQAVKGCLGYATSHDFAR